MGLPESTRTSPSPIRRALACAALLASFHDVADATGPEPAAFGQLPDASEFRVSPDGRYLSYVTPVNGVPVVVIAEPATGGQWPVLGVTEGGFRIHGCYWAKADRLLCVLEHTRIELRDPEGEFSVNVIDPRTRKVREILEGEPYFRLVNLLPTDPRTIAVGLADGLVGYPGVFLLDLYSGKRKRLFPARSHVVDWVLADDASVAAGWGLRDFDDRGDDDASNFILLWRRDTETVTDIAGVPAADKRLRLAGIDVEAGQVELIADIHGRVGLAALPFSGDAGLKPLFTDPTFDIEDPVSVPAMTQRLRGARFAREAPVAVWRDTAMTSLQQSLEKMHPGLACRIVDITADGSMVLYEVSADVAPPEVFMLDRKSGSSKLLAQHYPAMNAATLSPMQAVSYLARDGARIAGYLTLPRQSSGPPPLVVMPHGGPESRDVRDFDYWVQFLASSGYAVFQPNFRGSTGFGTAFLMAGRQAWGTRSHEDITDGVRWLIGEKLVDARRICIVGGSFGGYAALLGVAKEPDLYRCAVSFAGPSDLADLLFDFDKRLWRSRSRDRIGWDRAALREQSPRRLVAAIQAPVLLIHGAEDVVVEADHSERMRDALEKAGKPHRFILQKNGDHYLSSERHRIEFLAEVRKFIEESLR
jgi:dienelactone hydrolase